LIRLLVVAAITLTELFHYHIGAKGQLVVKGFEVSFRSELSDSVLNAYTNQPKKPTAQLAGNISDCTIAKNSRGEPLFGELKFCQINGRVLKKTITTVVYDLKKKWSAAG
jgi:hypothetical protein